MIRWYMLDTNMVTYIVNERSPAAAARLLALAPPGKACISVITEAELRYGIARKKGELRSRRAILLFLDRLDVLPWSRHEALTYGHFRAEQESLGKTLGPNDMLIAAHAISVGATLVTADKAFSHVHGLHSIENWATDLA